MASGAAALEAVARVVAGKLEIDILAIFIRRKGELRGISMLDPPYEQQLAIGKYWENIPGKTFLPGSVTSSDRFVRASFFLNSIPQTDNTRVAVASVFSVIRNVSVPYGFEIEGYPNLSTTRWRMVADQKNLVYYFETALTPNAFWVDLKKIDFSEKAAVRKLDLANHRTYSGETSGDFKKSAPFRFIGL